jgi:murein DD-endopeptidase MepM/ murein hydrolase activator NlpD
MKKNTRKIFSMAMLLLIVATYVIPINVYAESSPQTLGDLKDELAALKKKKSDNEANQKYTESQIKQREQAITNAESEITAAQGEIETAEENINNSNDKITELTEKVKNLLVFTQQMKSENAYLEYITGASTITDLIMRISAIEQTTRSSQETIENLESLIKENEQLKADMQKKQESLSAKITSYQATIKSLYGDLESYDKYALDIDTQIKTMQTQVDSYVKLCASSSKSYLGDSELLTDCTVVPYNAGWLKPLKKGTITSTIGTRWGSYHNALDIGGNAEGTPVYAAAAGTVAGFVSKYKCGGNMLYINVTVGGVKYTTYYYHLLTVNVKVGDVVTQNTVIGTVGGYSTATNHGGYDSCTTGAHLHFGVAKGYYSGSISRSNVITPPGFPNQSGYKFTSRTDYYG